MCNLFLITRNFIEFFFNVCLNIGVINLNHILLLQCFQTLFVCLLSVTKNIFSTKTKSPLGFANAVSKPWSSLLSQCYCCAGVKSSTDKSTAIILSLLFTLCNSYFYETTFRAGAIHESLQNLMTAFGGFHDFHFSAQLWLLRNLFRLLLIAWLYFHLWQHLLHGPCN